jgi:cytoskeleton protein RodZ
MSDEAAGNSAPEADTPPVEPATAAVPQTSAGQLLRQAREGAGVELPALALALKVSVKKLEALEADRYTELPDAVFVRALASSVCRALKIDAAPVLAQLPQSSTPRLNYDEAGLNTPFHTPGDVAKTPFLDRLSRPMVLAALAMMMGALVLIFFPSTEQRAEIGAIVAQVPAAPPAPAAAPVTESVVAPPPVVNAPAPSPAKAPVAAVREAAPVPVKPPVAPVTAPEPTPVPRTAPVAAAAPPQAEPGAAETPAPRKKLASTGVVVFKTSGPSWIEVTDGRGNIQLSRMVEPGEPVGASGPLPLNVTIGRAELTEVQVRGKPFSLDEFTRGGVARFEVK